MRRINITFFVIKGDFECDFRGYLIKKATKLVDLTAVFVL